VVNYYRYNILSLITSGASTFTLILIVVNKDGDKFASKPGLVFVYVNATPVRVTLVRVSGNPDQRTRVRAGTRTRVCVYALRLIIFYILLKSLLKCGGNF